MRKFEIQVCLRHGKEEKGIKDKKTEEIEAQK
jgi:hypothetical protein